MTDNSLSQSEKKLIDEARSAAEHSYSPYSEFAVGAALETNTNQIYTGCNIENASFGLSNCAERTALFKAVSEGERRFRTLALYGDRRDDLLYPCGACRQVLSEFGDEVTIVTSNAEGNFDRSSIRELLPKRFESDQIDG